MHIGRPGIRNHGPHLRSHADPWNPPSPSFWMDHGRAARWHVAVNPVDRTPLLVENGLFSRGIAVACVASEEFPSAPERLPARMRLWPDRWMDRPCSYRS